MSVGGKVSRGLGLNSGRALILIRAAKSVSSAEICKTSKRRKEKNTQTEQLKED